MAKRFTDTGKWDDPWFQDLSNEQKLIWIYILDKCDLAGVWKVNKKMMDFCLNINADLDSFLKISTDRIEVSGDKWLVKKFINFQYGSLSENNKVFRSVQSCLSSFGSRKGHISPIKGGKDKDKDKDKDKGGVGERGASAKPFQSMPTKEFVNLARKLATAKSIPNTRRTP